MKSDLHKALYGEMIGHLIKKMQKKMASGDEEEGGDVAEADNVDSESAVLAGKAGEKVDVSGDEDDSDVAEPVQIADKKRAKGIKIVAMGNFSKKFGKGKKA